MLTIFDEHLPAGGRGDDAAAAPPASADSAAAAAETNDSVVLPFERRERARQRVTLASGRDAGIVLPRGTVLRGGDALRSAASGETVEVVAAPEAVSTVHCEDRRQLARIAYHLGNRHVPLEVGAGWVRYGRDHVLDDMIRHLGADALHEVAPFEPEAGAYAAGHGHGHGHGHSHSHDDDRVHAHPHGQEHNPRHAHAQGHKHAHEHEHEHEHDRDHEHDREHDAAHGEGPERARALTRR